MFDVGNNLSTSLIPFTLACPDMVKQNNFVCNLLYNVVHEVACKPEGLAKFSLTNNYFTSVCFVEDWKINYFKIYKLIFHIYYRTNMLMKSINCS